MFTYLKNNKRTVFAITGTVVLALITILTAVILYRMRQQAQTTAPQESAAYTPASCEAVAFNISVPGEISCKFKRVFPNDTRNTAGKYYLSPDNIPLTQGAFVQPGQILVFAIRVGGTVSDKSVTVTDTLPQELDFVDSIAECKYTASSRKITCTVKSPSTVVYRAKVKSTVAANVQITNSASVVYTDGSGETTTCSANVKTTKGIACLSKLAYPDDARNSQGVYYLDTDHDPLIENAAVIRGQTIVYKIVLNGEDSGKTIKVTDVIPEGTVFVDADDGCTYSSSTRSLTCQYTTPLAQHEVRFRVRVNNDAETGVSITNTATVSYEDNSVASTSCTANLSLLTYTCNSDCTSTDQCQDANTNYICDTTTNKCRLESNPTSAICELTTSPTPTPTVTPTPTATATSLATATPTPTPTPTGNQTATPTPTATTKPTSTPTTKPGATPTNVPLALSSPTPGPELPKSGIGLPVIGGITLGTILLLMAIALVF